MSAAYHCSTFLIDVGPSMRQKRTAEEWVSDPQAPQGKRHVVREVTQLEYVMRWVIHKVQTALLLRMKTHKVHIMLFNSSTTNNCSAAERRPGNHNGIVEFWRPCQPSTQLVRSLARLQPESKVGPENADAIDALCSAINSLTTPSNSDIPHKPGSKSRWTRTIYIVTDGMTSISDEDLEVVQDTCRDPNTPIEVKVVGVGFNQSEQVMGKQKWASQRVWSKFLEPLGDLGGMISADDAVEQVHLPLLLPRTSAPVLGTLTFGDTGSSRMGAQAPDLLQIPVKVSSWTTQTRPISRTELASLVPEAKDEGLRAHSDVAATAAPTGAGGQAQPQAGTNLALAGGLMAELDVPINVQGEWQPFPRSGAGGAGGAGGGPGRAAAPSGGPGPAAGVNPVTKTDKWYDRQQYAEASALGKLSDVTPLSMDTPRLKGYKLGADIVSLAEEDMVVAETKSGLEIIKFDHQNRFNRAWMVGSVSYVVPIPQAPAASIGFSALVQGLQREGNYALARYVRSANAKPRLVVLFPQDIPTADEGSMQALALVDTAYSEDVREYAFPSLNFKDTPEGKIQQDAMDALVDRLFLKDDQGENWFDTEDLYSFNVQRLNQLAIHHATFPERPAPAPVADLYKYLQPPDFVVERAQGAWDAAKDTFQVRSFGPQANKRPGEAEEQSTDKRARPEFAAPAAPATTSGAAPASIAADPDRTRPDLADGTQDADATMPDTGNELHADEMEIGQVYPLTDPIAAFEAEVAVDQLGDIHHSMSRMAQTVVSLLLNRHQVETSNGPPQDLNSIDSLIRQCLRRARTEAQEQDVAPQWNSNLLRLRRWLARYTWGRTWWNTHIAPGGADPGANEAQPTPPATLGHVGSDNLASALELGLIPADPHNRVKDVDGLRAVQFVGPIAGSGFHA